MDDMKQIIAQNIANLRIGKRMTQLELAETLNYSDKAVSKWERGESLPDIITLKRMADLFGVTVDYIITEHAEGEKPHVSKIKRNNNIAITLIAFFVVWLVGTCIFVFLDLLILDYLPELHCNTVDALSHSQFYDSKIGIDFWLN